MVSLRVKDNLVHNDNTNPFLVLGSLHVEDTLDHISTPVFSVGTALLCFLIAHANFV